MSKTVIRTDRAALRSPTITPHGFVRADAHVARVGIYEYRNDDGSIRRELRPHEEVGDPDSLASYDTAPVTLNHPRNPDGTPGEVTAENVRKLKVGTVAGAARMDDDHVAATVQVEDAAAIKRAKSGTQELSPGYRIVLDEAPGADPRYGYAGNPEGRYDAVQRKIRVNHVALVDRARGGHTTRLRIDGAEILRDDAPLDAAERHHLPGSMFAVPEHDGLPLEDASHVRDAMARFSQEKFADAAQKKTAYRKILARAKELDIDASKFAEEHRADANVKLTTIADGHQHSIDLDGSWSPWGSGSPMAGCTSYAVATGKEHGHSHDWIRNSDGTITIAMSEDHTHGILDGDDAQYGGNSAAPGQRVDAVFDRSAVPPEHGPMTTNQTGSAPLPDAAEQIRLLTARADEADRTAIEQRSRADSLAADRDGLKAELATVKERLKVTEERLNAGAAAVETAAVLEQRRRADAAEREVAQVKASIPPLIRQRATLERKVTAVLGPTFRTDGLSDRDLLVHGVRHLMPKEPTGPEVSDDYLRRRLDALIEDRTTYSASLQRASDTLAMRTPTVTPPASKPGQQTRADELPWADQWKAGLGQFSTANVQKGS